MGNNPFYTTVHRSLLTVPKKPNRNGSYVFHDSKGKLYARVQIRLPNGKYKTVKKRAKNRTHVMQLAQEIKAQFAARGEAYFVGESLRFDQLADWYHAEYLTPAVYNEEGVKIAGMRTYKTEANKLKRLGRYFAGTLVKDITEHELYQFKRHRFEEGVKVATVNRDLELLRAMFGRAFRKRWISFFRNNQLNSLKSYCPSLQITQLS